MSQQNVGSDLRTKIKRATAVECAPVPHEPPWLNDVMERLGRLVIISTDIEGIVQENKSFLLGEHEAFPEGAPEKSAQKIGSGRTGAVTAELSSLEHKLKDIREELQHFFMSLSG